MPNKTFLSMLVVVFTVAALLVFQATRESSASVLRTEDLIAAAATGKTLERIRLGARVANMPIEYTTEPSIKLKFHVVDPAIGGQPLAVEYEGLKPDMFANGRDVILDGRLSQGVFHASQLLTQCPSKYEPPQPTP